MKLFLSICALIILGLLVFGAALLFFNTKPSQSTQSNSNSTFPVSSSAPGQTASVTQTTVQKSFTSQIQNANQITLGGTVVVMPYSLQIWGDANKGGEALLKYNQSTGWTLVSLGGGVWDVPSLVQEGVPESIAEQLIAKDQ